MIVGDAFVAIRPDTKNFAKDTESQVGSSLSSTAKKIALGFTGAFATVKAVNVFKGFLADATESAKVSAQTEAVIRSTGGAAGVTAGQVGDLANALAAKTGIDDEAIQSGQNLLLSFTQVQNRVGAGNDIFNQASKTLLDMSAAMGGDAKGSAIQLGKALNDPVAGLTALTRVGVTFSAAQKEQIKGFVAVGDVASAQKVILSELNKEFGGSAEAQATGAAKLQVVLGNLREEIGGKLLPVVTTVADFLSRNLPAALAATEAAFSRVFDFIQPFVTTVRTAFTGLLDGLRGIDPGDKLAASLEAAEGRVTKAKQDGQRLQNEATQKVASLEQSVKDIRVKAATDVTDAIQKHASDVKAAHQKVIDSETNLRDRTIDANAKVTDARKNAADVAVEQDDRIRKVQESAAERNRSAEDKLTTTREKAARSSEDSAKKVTRAEEDLAKARSGGSADDILRATRDLEDARTEAARSAVDSAKDVKDAEADATKAAKEGIDDVKAAEDEKAKAVEDASKRVDSALKDREKSLADASKAVRDARAGEAAELAKQAADIKTIRDKETADVKAANADLDAARKAQVASVQQAADLVAKAEDQKVKDVEAANARYVASLTGFEADARRIGTEITAIVKGFFDPDAADTNSALAKFTEFGVKARAVFDQITTTVKTVVDWISHNLPASINIALAALIIFGGPVTATIALFGTLYVKSQLFRDIVAGIPGVISGIVGVVQTTVDTVSALWDRFGEPIQRIIDGVLTLFVGQINYIKEVLQGVVTFITGVFTGDWGKAWDGLKELFLAPWHLIQSTISGFGSIALGAIQGLGKLLGPVWSGVWNGLKNVVTGAFNGVIDIVRGLPGRLLTFVGTIASAGTRIGAGFLSAIISAVSSAPAQLGTALTSAGKSAFNAMAAIAEGMINLIVGAVNAMIRFINSIQVRIPRIHILGTNQDIGGGTIGLPNIPQLNGGQPIKLPRLAEGAFFPAVPGGVLVAARAAEHGVNEGMVPLPDAVVKGLAAIAAGGGGTSPLVGTLVVQAAAEPFVTGWETVRALRSEQYRRTGRF